MTLVKSNFRTFNDLFDEFFTQVPATQRNGSNGNIPPVNVHETNDAFHVELIAPGLQKEDFKVAVEKGLLTIGYEKKSETENKDYKTHRREFSVRSFKRSFHVDEKMDAERIQAKYENGVLKLLLPKKEEVKETPKQITIE
jgi:HSP20 family protein